MHKQFKFKHSTKCAFIYKSFSGMFRFYSNFHSLINQHRIVPAICTSVLYMKWLLEEPEEIKLPMFTGKKKQLQKRVWSNISKWCRYLPHTIKEHKKAQSESFGFPPLCKLVKTKRVFSTLIWKSYMKTLYRQVNVFWMQ